MATAGKPANAMPCTKRPTIKKPQFGVKPRIIPRREATKREIKIIGRRPRRSEDGPIKNIEMANARVVSDSASEAVTGEIEKNFEMSGSSTCTS